MADPSAYKIVFNFDGKFTDSIANEWKGRYCNNLDYSDWIAVRGASGQSQRKFDIYAACHASGGGRFIRLLEGYYMSLVPGSTNREHLFADILATRQCPNKKTGRLESRTFVLKFDREKFAYGPPDGDADLIEPCSDKEMSLPFVWEGE
jgi:hypothetical protein